MGLASVVVGAVLLCACLLLGWFAVRRVRLMRGGGVDLCLRRRPVSSRRTPGGVRTVVDDGAGWHFGVGRYEGDEFGWHRLTSVRLGPTVRIDRSALEIVDRRTPGPNESYAIPHAMSVLHCRADGRDLELAMAPGVLTGFLAWLESAPPGRTTGYRQAS